MKKLQLIWYDQCNVQHHMGENEYWYPKCRQAWAAQQVYRTQFWSFLYWQRNINVWSWLESLAHFPCIPQWSQDRQAFHVSKESSMPEMLCSPLHNAFPRHRHGPAPRHGNRALTASSGESCSCLDNWHPTMLCPSNFKHVLILPLFGFQSRLMRKDWVFGLHALPQLLSVA